MICQSFKDIHAEGMRHFTQLEKIFAEAFTIGVVRVSSRIDGVQTDRHLEPFLLQRDNESSLKAVSMKVA